MSQDGISEFTLTPDERRYFLRFFRRSALPWTVGTAAGVSLVAALILAALLSQPASEYAPRRDHVPVEMQAELEAMRTEIRRLSQALDGGEAAAGATPELAADLSKLTERLGKLDRRIKALEKRKPETAAAGGTDDKLDERVEHIEQRQEGAKAARDALLERIEKLERYNPDSSPAPPASTPERATAPPVPAEPAPTQNVAPDEPTPAAPYLD